jgi:hypothetical protein
MAPVSCGCHLISHIPVAWDPRQRSAMGRAWCRCSRCSTGRHGLVERGRPLRPVVGLHPVGCANALPSLVPQAWGPSALRHQYAWPSLVADQLPVSGLTSITCGRAICPAQGESSDITWEGQDHGGLLFKPRPGPTGCRRRVGPAQAREHGGLRPVAPPTRAAGRCGPADAMALTANGSPPWRGARQGIRRRSES